ncbi:MAG: hypothetical protein KC422_19845 [Trueperaceae bacterium]|nr:hypothetical protein [Trueperaceae bacterium]
MKLFAPLVPFIFLCFIPFTFAQERTSLLGALTERGLLVFSEQSAEPTLVEGHDITQEHYLELSNGDGSSTPLWLWLAQNEGQDYVPYISVGYRGVMDDASAEAFGYLYGFVATSCMGFEVDDINAINEFVFGFFPNISEYWFSDSREFGEVMLTIGGQLEGEELSLIIDYQHSGTPGVASWEHACGLE